MLKNSTELPENHLLRRGLISFVPKPALSAQEQKKRTDLWEQKLTALDEKLRASGLMVTVETEPADSDEYLVVFPPNQRNQEHQTLLPLGGSHGVTVEVSWGYEEHDVHVSARKWKRIRSGEAVMVKSIGWYEGKSFECRWYFDPDADHSLIVSYGDDGADGFVGNILDATIEGVSNRNEKRRAGRSCKANGERTQQEVSVT